MDFLFTIKQLSCLVAVYIHLNNIERKNMNHKKLKEQVEKIYEVVSSLEQMFPDRSFTPDGHLIGSIGECLVADAYNLELMPSSNKGFDAKTENGKKVEIKATQSKQVAFRSEPEHTIIIKINKDGTFDEIYNGPGNIIWETFKNKKLPSNGQYQISLIKLKKLYKKVATNNRIPLKNIESVKSSDF